MSEKAREQTVAFIGAGNMAGSLIGGWLEAGKRTGVPRTVRVSDVNDEQLDRLSSQFSEFSIHTGPSNKEAVEGADLVVIAVKPNVVQAVCEDIANDLQQTPVVSVAAGVRCADMASWLTAGSTESAAKVIRCMPNTPALLGAGITGLYASPGCDNRAKALATDVLEAVGKVIWVDKEALLDSVTAISGSGPAYFFYMMESMNKAGVELGLDQDAAMTFAIETAYGAALMARGGQLPPATLRENVTSKGGTTAAALESFKSDRFEEIVEKAMRAAHDRAVAMGDEFGP